MVDYKEPSAVKVQRMSSSAVKVFKVLDVLNRNFFHGFSNKEISDETGYSPSSVNGYLNTLIEAGYAEIIPETQRYRPSCRLAQKAVQIMNALDAAEDKLKEIKSRVYAGQSLSEIEQAKNRLTRGR